MEKEKSLLYYFCWWSTLAFGHSILKQEGPPVVRVPFTKTLFNGGTLKFPWHQYTESQSQAIIVELGRVQLAKIRKLILAYKKAIIQIQKKLIKEIKSQCSMNFGYSKVSLCSPSQILRDVAQEKFGLPHIQDAFLEFSGLKCRRVGHMGLIEASTAAFMILQLAADMRLIACTLTLNIDGCAAGYSRVEHRRPLVYLWCCDLEVSLGFHIWIVTTWV